MKQFRRSWLDDSDAPEEMSPQLALLSSRQARLAVVLIYTTELYRHLRARLQREGHSEVLGLIALEAANDLGVLLQDLRRHQDWVDAYNGTGVVSPIPLATVDELYHSLVLLCASDENGLPDVPIEPEVLDELVYGDSDVHTWLEGLGVDVEATRRAFDEPD